MLELLNQEGWIRWYVEHVKRKERLGLRSVGDERMCMKHNKYDTDGRARKYSDTETSVHHKYEMY